MGKDSDFNYTGEELASQFKLKDGKLQYLVVGTGRCGTVYMAKFLSSINIPCTHEGVFYKDGIDGAIARIKGESPIEISDIAKMSSYNEENLGKTWFKEKVTEIVADSSYMAAPFVNHDILKNTTIIHVVRKPMAVINSFVEGLGYFRDESFNEPYLKPYHEFIYKYIPTLKQPLDAVSRAALYWLKWNDMIVRFSTGKRYYLHQIENKVDNLMAFLNVPMQPYYNNQKSNHKDGLICRYHNFKDIPVLSIRKKVEAMYNQYYNK